MLRAITQQQNIFFKISPSNLLELHILYQLIKFEAITRNWPSVYVLHRTSSKVHNVVVHCVVHTYMYCQTLKGFKHYQLIFDKQTAIITRKQKIALKLKLIVKQTNCSPKHTQTDQHRPSRVFQLRGGVDNLSWIPIKHAVFTYLYLVLSGLTSLHNIFTAILQGFYQHLPEGQLEI